MSKKRKKRKGPTIADRADRHALYEKSVQCAEAEIPFFERAFKNAYKRKPVILREDFCGTATVCCEWVKSKKQRLAYGVDFDPDPLEWGRENNLGKLKKNARKRVELLQGDVLDVKSPEADILAAQNFSFFTFKTRSKVIDYFRAVHQNLAAEGVVILDVFGGPESITEDQQESRDIGNFEYVWDQHRFDPITHDCTFHIHFKFDDGSKLRRAFTYEWRWWSIPEIREMLQEAGFERSDVYWEGTDSDGEGDGVYRRCAHAPSDPAWVSYVVGVK